MTEKEAKQIIEQWDQHDRHRLTPAEQVFWGEPTEVILARKFLKARKILRELAKAANDVTLHEDNLRELVFSKVREFVK